jgi:hypothetical protein
MDLPLRPREPTPHVPVPGARADAAARLRAEVAARLRPVCASMPAEEFARLVEDVAAFKLRWASELGVSDHGVTVRAD